MSYIRNEPEIVFHGRINYLYIRTRHDTHSVQCWGVHSALHSQSAPTDVDEENGDAAALDINKFTYLFIGDSRRPARVVGPAIAPLRRTTGRIAQIGNLVVSVGRLCLDSL
jgi:hypothetical protein